MTCSGKVTGTGGHFFIDENLLSQVSFIREGEFSEKKGRPVLKIIGEARSINHSATGKGERAQIYRTKGIRASDIILGFLRSEKIAEPNNYITQICHENSAFLPFYFLLKQANMSMSEATIIVNNEHSTQQAKVKLLERIADDSSLKMTMPSEGNASGQRKLGVRSALLKKKIPANPDKPYLIDFLLIIRTLQKNEVDAKFLKGHLEKLFNRHYAQGDSRVNDEIRRAVCYLDWLLNQSYVRK